MEEKVKIIDRIVKYHPAYGKDIGWSYYVGGMADTGGWYFRQMLNEPIEKLQSFLDTLMENEQRPKPDKKVSHLEAYQKFCEDRLRVLMGGKL